MSTYDEAKLQEYIASLEREKAMMDDMNTPLTKPKRATKKVEEPIPQPQVDPPLQTPAVAPTAPTAPTKPVKEKKPRKPKTPAQLEAFHKMLDAKNNNWKRRKIDQRLNDVKELLKIPQQPTPQPKQQSESSSDESPVIIHKDKKKKKKKIIIVDSSDSSDSESSYEKVEHKKEPKDFGKARQNRNNYVKPSEPKPQYNQQPIHQQNQQNQQQKPRNFFCD